MKKGGENRKILVIEDNPINMKLVRDLLLRGEYAVFEATDAKAGMHLAREHEPALILMDIQLPGMDGLTATQCIKNDPVLEGIPVVAMTAHAMRGDDRKAREAGCDGYLSKPIDTRSFLGWLSQFLEGNACDRRFPRRKGIDHKNRVLIVDNDPLNTKLLESKLPPDRYEIFVATSGGETLEKAAETPPDVILFNDVAPGMDGRDVIRRLRAGRETEHVPIITVTPVGKSDKGMDVEADIDEFINKPVNTTELLSRIKSVLRFKQYREQLTINRQTEDFFALPALRGEPVQGEGCPSVLLVGGDEKDARLVRNHLQEQSLRLLIAGNGEEALSLASREKIDLVLMDIILPRIDGFEACRRLKEMPETRHVPVVAITRLQDLENRVKSVECGVDDYLVKPINARELRARVNIFLKKKRYIDALQNTYGETFGSKVMDRTTELFNYLYFKRFLEFEVDRSVRHGYPVALAFVDIDDFKRHSGNSEGAAILQELAELIRGNVRDLDLVARYSDDVFAVVMPYCDREEVEGVFQRIRKAFASSSRPTDSPSRGGITLSTGIAFSPADVSRAEELVQNAESMLYRAKKEGKNRVYVSG